MENRNRTQVLIIIGLTLFTMTAVKTFAQQKPPAAADPQALADKLPNPVANLISVPMQKCGAGLGLNAEITSDWQHQTTTAFLNPIVTAVSKLGTQIVSLGVGPRIPIAGPSASKADFGFRGVLTFVFPK